MQYYKKNRIMDLNNIKIIPMPLSVKKHDGQFVFGAETTYGNKAEKFRKFISLPFLNGGGGRISMVESNLPMDEYHLEIKPQGVKIEASSYSGFFWAMMTLKQLVIANFKDGLAILPCLEISDAPKFKHRGFMLDTARHFFDFEFLKKIIDVLSLFKFNVLHLHLSDDQGFRFPSNKFPNLTKVGSVRAGTKGDGVEVKGFYTTQQLTCLVEYANERSITIIPEIDMPAHAGAMIASYPNLSCKQDKREVSQYFGVINNVMCAGKAEVYDFVTALLNEVIEIFPSKLIHIGGDEAVKDDWENCSNCQRMIKNYSLSGTMQLQGLFMNTISEYLKKKGRKAVVWNEALNSGKLGNDIICQYWAEGRKPKNVLAFADGGGEVIVSKCNPYYLDYPHGMHSLKAVYEFDPLLDGLTGEALKNIIGIEAPLWTEYVVSEKEVWEKMFPRLLAVSERAWSSDKNYARFFNNLDMVQGVLDCLGVGYTKKEEANISGLKAAMQTVSFGLKAIDKTTITSLKNIIKINKNKSR